MSHCELFSAKQGEEIFRRSLQILEKRGCTFEDGKALSLLADCGCRIERQGSRVLIPTARMVAALEKRAAGGGLSSGNTTNIAAGVATQLWNIRGTKLQKAGWDECGKIVALMERLPYITSVSYGVRPEGLTAQQVEIAGCEIVLKYSHKPFQVQTTSPALAQDILDMATVAAGSKADLATSARCHGCIQLSKPCYFHLKELQLLQLYAEYRQPIHLISYAYPLSMSPADLLTMQLMEWLAVLYYLCCLDAALPVYWEFPNYVKQSAAQSAANHYVKLLLLQSAVLQLGHTCRVPISFPAFPATGTWDFASGWYAGLCRIFGMTRGLAEIGYAGVVGNGFSISQLILENEIAGYLSCIDSQTRQTIADWKTIASILQGDRSATTANALEKSSMWKSELFRNDVLELWRNRKADTDHFIDEHIANRWQTAAPNLLLNQNQCDSLQKIQKEGRSAKKSL